MESSGPPDEPPSTPYRRGSHANSFNMIARPEHTTVPPSPGVPAPGFDGSEPTSPTRGRMRMLKALTGAGVQKRPAKKVARPSLEVVTDARGAAKAPNRGSTSFFRFMDLPGGIELCRPRKLARADCLQRFATRSTATRMSSRSKLCLFIGRALPLSAPARVLIEDAPSLLM